MQVQVTDVIFVGIHHAQNHYLLVDTPCAETNWRFVQMTKILQQAGCHVPIFDIVSLLRDGYIRWPETQVLDWLKCYYRAAISQDIFGSTLSFEQLKLK
jgi:aminoglycoside/choline kinase family phosphotransferase